MQSRPTLPSYDDLPVIPELGLPHSWDHFGRDDPFGTLNLLTDDRVREAAGLVREGRVISLSLPADQPSPPLFGREPFRHEGFWIDRNTWDERLDGYYPQSSTQWDGFRHFRAREHGFYGGRTGDAPQGIGIEHWARRGIVGRGVLLDVEGHLRARGESIPHDERRIIPATLLAEVAEAQGTDIRTGDILLVRTGWPAAYAASGVALPSHPELPGLEAGEPTARLLWDWHVAACVTDLPSVEPVPGDRATGSLHRRILALLGIPVGELFDLEELAGWRSESGRSEFLFTAAPFHLPEGAGSPGNALAIV